MYGTEVQLLEMLMCRERRAEIQNRYTEQYHEPVISFCMNIPGPVKTNNKIRNAFDQGLQILTKTLFDNQIEILNAAEYHEPTGDECIMAVSGDAASVKKIAVKIEETHPLGRLFDIDVIDTDGMKLSRGTYRRCLICGCQAQECARSRRHTIKEMQEKIDEMLS